ncbi:MAG: hypothetical protein A3A08_02745 [Candidatus Nealsonbacteria bacterium RIFCSPLOWO2_01_FULL_41_9]|uniref:Uncharacterized protein n=1 Tax=Candidatus Nealsonbacteria bacterium RIFCSPLOWO2_01_FULL_41_9 TaxID=1801671 RepID=A0A1G2EDF7_9BACT|nr:MAG: hypothetical protein A3A08_02745 [Candidatus Nealsonbacteria bacterium RIFCSPLOWO2_01_FULL_41_9]
MSFESAFQVLLILSSLAILGLVFRKLPVLAGLPLISEKGFDLKPVFLKLAEKIKALPFLKNFSFEMFLQKVLSKIRVLTMKTENQTFAWLSQLRKRAQDNHNKENDTYWEDLKKLKDKNSPT